MSHDKFVSHQQKRSITVKEETKAIATQSSLCRQQKERNEKNPKEAQNN
jgi:hypothetical protein